MSHVLEPLLPKVATRNNRRVRKGYSKSKIALLIALILLLTATTMNFIEQVSKRRDQPRMFQIVVYGDSITENGSNRNGFVEILNQRNIRRADIVNRGFSGYKTNDLLDYIVPITQHLAADLSFLLIGTNDARTYSDQCCTVEEYINNIFILIDKFQLHTKDLVLVTPPPTSDTQAHDNEHTKQYRDAIILIGNKTRLTVIDSWQFMDFGDLNDGVHFNDNGNRKMADAYQTVIDSYHLPHFLP